MPDLSRVAELNEDVEYTIKDMFLYHSWDEDMVKKGDEVRASLISAVRTIIAAVPPPPDRSAAIRKLREARMDCNSAITHGGKY